MAQRLNILFIHQNFPGQYKHLAPALAKEGHQVVALGLKKAKVPGVKMIPYKLLRGQTPGIHPLAQEHEAKVIRGEAVAKVCNELKRKGFTPDVIYVHPGWGEALFLRDVFPDSKIIVYCEYYYNLEGQDVNFDPEFPPLTFEEQCKLRMKNTCNLHALEIGDAFVSPTRWQRRTYPESFRKRIRVIHDGIVVQDINQQAEDIVPRCLSHIDGLKNKQIVTYVARHLEPVRGFHFFMRALPEILGKNSEAIAVVVGDEIGYYGAADGKCATYKDRLLSEIGSKLDSTRLIFTQTIPRGEYAALLTNSAVHVHLSYPFVLSWSLLEAAALGLPLVVAEGEQFSEFIDRDSSTFVHQFSISSISKAVLEILEERPRRRSRIRRHMRRPLQLEYVLEKNLALIEALCAHP